MTPFVAGIPTLNRYDCLLNCLRHIDAGSAKPAVVYIVDNGASRNGGLGLKEDWLTSFSFPLEIIRPRRNLGVAASWNLLHKITAPTMLCFVNDDIYVGKNTLELLIKEPPVNITTAEGWSCFRQDHEVWDIVGDYDENLFPAYCEDNDYDRRREIAGVKRVIMENECRATHPIGHTRSATLARMTPAELAEFDAQYQKSMAYYRAKWSGFVGEEKVTVPFSHHSEATKAELRKQWRNIP